MSAARDIVPRGAPEDARRGVSCGVPEAAMVMAAGRGTRMGALTDKIPKPLIPVAGRALIDHALDMLAGGGVRRAVVNLHHLGDMIRDHLAARKTPEIAFSEEPELLETGGGVAKALPALGRAPFYTMNADAIFVGADPVRTLAASWNAGRMGALLHLVPRGDAVGYTRPGDFSLGEDGRLSRREGAATAPFVYTGAQIIAPDAFDDTPKGAFSTNLVWDRLIEQRRLFGVVHRGVWVDVGTPEGLRLADEALA